MSFTKLVIIASHVPVFAVALYAWGIYAKLKEELKVFSWFLFAIGVLQFVSLILWFLKTNNLFLLHIMVPVRVALLLWFYQSVLKNFLNKSILLLTGVGFVVFSIINSIFFQSFMKFNSNALVAESVLCMILSLSSYMIFLNKVLVAKNREKVYSLNWLNSGLFIYYSSTLLIFYFGDYIYKYLAPELNRYMWIVHSCFSVIMYSCFWMGLWKREVK